MSVWFIHQDYGASASGLTGHAIHPEEAANVLLYHPHMQTVYVRADGYEQAREIASAFLLKLTYRDRDAYATYEEWWAAMRLQMEARDAALVAEMELAGFAVIVKPGGGGAGSAKCRVKGPGYDKATTCSSGSAVPAAYAKWQAWMEDEG